MIELVGNINEKYRARIKNIQYPDSVMVAMYILSCDQLVYGTDNENEFLFGAGSFGLSFTTNYEHFDLFLLNYFKNGGKAELQIYENDVMIFDADVEYASTRYNYDIAKSEIAILAIGKLARLKNINPKNISYTNPEVYLPLKEFINHILSYAQLEYDIEIQYQKEVYLFDWVPSDDTATWYDFETGTWHTDPSMKYAFSMLSPERIAYVFDPYENTKTSSAIGGMCIRPYYVFGRYASQHNLLDMLRNLCMSLGFTCSYSSNKLIFKSVIDSLYMHAQNEYRYIDTMKCLGDIKEEVIPKKTGVRVKYRYDITPEGEYIYAQKKYGSEEKVQDIVIDFVEAGIRYDHIGIEFPRIGTIYYKVPEYDISALSQNQEPISLDWAQPANKISYGYYDIATIATIGNKTIPKLIPYVIVDMYANAIMKDRKKVILKSIEKYNMYEALIYNDYLFYVNKISHDIIHDIYEYTLIEKV